MKISKYIHSCLLFEQDDYQLLVDPGTFTFAEGLVKPGDFASVNAIIITHNHPDHLDVGNLKKIVELSNAIVYTTAEVAEQLQKEAITSLIVEHKEYKIGPFNLVMFPIKHQLLLDSPTPQMFGFLMDGMVLHPVDSFEDSMLQFKGIELLILPTMAPFATELEIAAFADKMAPKKILPVHDGFAKDFFIEQRYKLYTTHFEKSGTKFHPVYKPGESISI